MGDAPPSESKYNIKIWHLAMQRTTQVVANSEFIQSKILKQHVSKSKVNKIYSLVPSRLSSTAIQVSQGYQKDNQLIYVGQLSEEKGLWELLRAFTKTDNTNLNLIILGDSRYSKSFKKELEQWVNLANLNRKIAFLGQVPDPFPFYKQALVHVAPSIWDEPLANVVLEAKKAGIPSIVFPSGGLPEMVRHKIDGYICRDKTPEALSEAIEWMISDKERLKAMGKSTFEDCEIRFGRQRFLQEWANIYLNTLRS